MYDNTFLDKLRKRYNYDDKTINALSLIIPKTIDYYGKEYEDLILSALYDTKIVPCSSQDTISKVLRERENTQFGGSAFVSDIDLKRAESVYAPSVRIIYDEEENSYKIADIDRMIVTSHTYNFDSLKGIEVLTHAICHLIKSYKDEFMIDENMLIIRNGLSYEKRKIIYGEELSLSQEEEYGRALQEGFNILDTEKIVSKVCMDDYKSYDFNSIHTVALILKDKYKFSKEINSYEINGDIYGFQKRYGEDFVNSLSSLCDKCLNMENDMLLSYTREDKDILSAAIYNILNNDIYDNLVNMYQYKETVRS